MAIRILLENVLQNLKSRPNCGDYPHFKALRSTLVIHGRCMTNDVPDPNTVQELLDTDDDENEQMEIDKIRDISGLTFRQRAKLKHVNIMVETHPDDAKYWEKTVGRKRRQFAKYGFASGIHPGYSWPTKETIDELREIEQSFESPLKDRIAINKAEKQEEADGLEARMAEIDKKMAEMPRLIEKYRQKLADQETERQTQLRKREAMLEEAREFFGYEVKPNDPKFKQMLDKKAEEEKLLKRQQKKEFKQQKFLDSLKLAKGQNATSG